MRVGAITFSLAIITAVIFASQSALAYAGGAGRSKMSGGDPTFHSTTACTGGKYALRKKP